jgi:signal transduction histidine kinase
VKPARATYPPALAAHEAVSSKARVAFSLSARLYVALVVGPLAPVAALVVLRALGTSDAAALCTAAVLALAEVVYGASIARRTAGKARRIARVLEIELPPGQLAGSWDELDTLEHGVEALTSRLSDDSNTLRKVVEFARRAGRAKGADWTPRALEEALRECVPSAEWRVVALDQIDALPDHLHRAVVRSSGRARTGEYPEARLSDPGMNLAHPEQEAWVVEFGGVVQRGVVIGIRVTDVRARRIAQLLVRVAQSSMRQSELASTASNNEKLAALGRLAAGVTHEINNALAALHTNLQILSSELTGPHAEAAADAMLGAERVERIVKDLATLSRGGARIDTVERDLGAILLSAVKATASRRPSVRVQVEDVRGVRVRCDPGRIEQVCVNLVANAMDAAAESETKQVRVSIRCEHNLVHVDVHDSGQGIPADRKAHIFEPFFTTKGEGGTGLGLYISRTLARAHGGDIEVRSSSTRGSTFTLTLPTASLGENSADERIRNSERARRELVA